MNVELDREPVEKTESGGDVQPGFAASENPGSLVLNMLGFLSGVPSKAWT